MYNIAAAVAVALRRQRAHYKKHDVILKIVSRLLNVCCNTAREGSIYGHRRHTQKFFFEVWTCDF